MSQAQALPSSCLLGVVSLLALIGCGPPDPILACEYPSIQAALDVAPLGWRVLICNGVHSQALTIRRSVELFGESQNGTVLTGGGSVTMATIHDVSGPVSLRDLTLRPPAGASATRTALSIVDSPHVTLARLGIDLSAIPSPKPADPHPQPQGGPPAFNGLIGIDVATAGAELSQISLRNIGPEDTSSIGLRVRGLSSVHGNQIEIDGTGGPAVLSSDAQLKIEHSAIRRGNTDGVGVLSGDMRLSDTTLETFKADGLSVSGGYLRTDGVQVRAALRYGVLAAGGIVDLNTTRIEGTGEGIHSTFGLVAASGCTIKDAREFGLYAHDSGVISFEKGVVEGGRIGVFSDFADAYVTLSDTSIKKTVGRGIEVRDGQFLMTGGSIDQAGSEGVWAAGGSVLLDATTISNSRGDGVVVTGTTSATLAAITSRGNSGWGVLCDGGGVGMQSKAQLEACTGFFTGNVLGPYRLFNNCQILYMCIPL